MLGCVYVQFFIGAPIKHKHVYNLKNIKEMKTIIPLHGFADCLYNLPRTPLQTDKTKIGPTGGSLSSNIFPPNKYQLLMATERKYLNIVISEETKTSYWLNPRSQWKTRIFIIKLQYMYYTDPSLLKASQLDFSPLRRQSTNHSWLKSM